jgi:cation:H+ antiporter
LPWPDDPGNRRPDGLAQRSGIAGPVSWTTGWRRRLAATVAATAPGLLVRLSGGALPYPAQVLFYGAAVVAAAFLLAWACEAAQVDVAHGLVVAVVAFVAILPEFIVEVHFALTGQAEFVTANLTGASRLLVGCAVALPAAVALLPKGRRPPLGHLELPEPHRIELVVLALGAVWSMRGVLSGRFNLLDAAVLIGLYVFYLRQAADAGGEAPEPLGIAAELAALDRAERRRWVAWLMGYAAFVILVTAVPFGDAVLGAGTVVGISPYLMVQWVVPIATETPELVVASVLLLHGRGGQSIAVLLAGAVSQYTLALGTLPLAYAVGKAHGPLPLAGRERIELLLTVGVALYAIAALVRLRLSRGDSSIMLVLFAGQLLIPAVFTRFVFAVVFWAIAIDVLIAERRDIRALFTGPRAAGRSARRGRSRRARSRTRSRAEAVGTRSPRP